MVFKKLVANDKKIYHLDRDKISGIIAQDDENTAFIIDGVFIQIKLNHENALTWLTSFDPPPERSSRPDPS